MGGLSVKLSAFDLHRGCTEYVQLPSGRCINVHVARLTNCTEVHVQANSEQWPQIYSDSLTHNGAGVTVYHSVTKGLTHTDIKYLQTRFSK